MTKRLAWAVATLALVAGGALVVTAAPALAVDITVTVDNAGDPAVGNPANCPAVPAGTCTARDAFAAVTANGGNDTISFVAGLAQITLTNGALAHTAGTGLTLNGNGVVIDGNNASRVINDTSGGPLTINNTTIQHGLDTSANAVGGINAGGDVTLNSSTVTENSAQSSTGGTNCGGIFADGDLTLNGSHVTDNTAGAPPGSGVATGIAVAGAVGVDAIVATNSVISGNHAFQGFIASVGGMQADLGVTLTGTTVADNVGSFSIGSAGGVLSFGDVVVTGSTISHNTGDNSIDLAVGGIGAFDFFGPSAATISLTDSTVSNNDASADNNAAGGLGAQSTITVTRSTVNGNTGDGSGGTAGGIGAAGSTGDVIATNSTITGNTATDATVGGPRAGGGIAATHVTLVYTTLVANAVTTPGGQSAANVLAGDTRPGVVPSSVGHLTLFASVIALPQGGAPNCAFDTGTTTPNGYSFSDDASCLFTGPGDLQSAGDPMLAALANNGGPTQTRLPTTGSPLINGVPGAACQADGAAGVTTDQRGITRPQGAACDIGAVEVVVVARFTG